jgi:phosphoribosylglycinamide formyltransferase-1
MRLLTPPFVEAWRDCLLNIHPSLLPAFRGLHTHARAVAAGVRIHGCTVHLVRPELDDGPILVQGAAPVLPGDTEATLAARVLRLEHRCYPLALRLLASGRARVEGERVVVVGRAAGGSGCVGGRVRQAARSPRTARTQTAATGPSAAARDRVGLG